MLVKIEARILIFPGTDFHFPSTSVPPGTFLGSGVSHGIVNHVEYPAWAKVIRRLVALIYCNALSLSQPRPLHKRRLYCIDQVYRIAPCQVACRYQRAFRIPGNRNTATHNVPRDGEGLYDTHDAAKRKLSVGTYITSLTAIVSIASGFNVHYYY